MEWSIIWNVMEGIRSRVLRRRLMGKGRGIRGVVCLVKGMEGRLVVGRGGRRFMHLDLLEGDGE